MVLIRFASLVLGLLYLLHALRDSSVYAQGSGMHGNRLMEVDDVSATSARKMMLEGRKMLADEAPRREVEKEEDQLNGGTSKISGASATHSARKCHGKKDLNVKYRVLLSKSAKLPKKSKGAGFVAFTTDYHDPINHPPRNN